MKWPKILGTTSQARKVIADARKDVKRPSKDEVAEQRQKKTGGQQ